MTNYMQYAEEYLTLWEDVDSDACAVFSSNWRGRPEEREKRVRRALHNYDIARNFGEKPEKKAGKKRFEPIFRVIDAVRLDDFAGPVEAVEHVRKGIKGVYGVPHSESFFVAASKILWFKFKSPIVICDSRAMEALGLKGKQRCYKTFHDEWHKKFKAEEAAISKACDALAKKHPGHKKLISERSFRERVFDRRLWVEGA